VSDVHAILPGTIRAAQAQAYRARWQTFKFSPHSLFAAEPAPPPHFLPAHRLVFVEQQSELSCVSPQFTIQHLTQLSSRAMQPQFQRTQADIQPLRNLAVLLSRFNRLMKQKSQL
jgi:hypothetical protein